VVCRAFASLADFVAAAGGLMGASTVLAAMKGQRAGLEAEIAALPAGWQADVESVSVPFLPAERHLAWLRPPATGRTATPSPGVA
jgi:16S rRNA G527 N7-methylase RsmG